jgi:hypothetical protein
MIHAACSNHCYLAGSDYLISQLMHPVQMLVIVVVHCGVGEANDQGQQYMPWQMLTTGIGVRVDKTLPATPTVSLLLVQSTAAHQHCIEFGYTSCCTAAASQFQVWTQSSSAAPRRLCSATSTIVI